jgi:hypothetical protein
MDIDNLDGIGVDNNIGPDEAVKRVESKFQFAGGYDWKP